MWSLWSHPGRINRRYDIQLNLCQEPLEPIHRFGGLDLAPHLQIRVPSCGVILCCAGDLSSMVQQFLFKSGLALCRVSQTCGWLDSCGVRMQNNTFARLRGSTCHLVTVYLFWTRTLRATLCASHQTRHIRWSDASGMESICRIPITLRLAVVVPAGPDLRGNLSNS